MIPIKGALWALGAVIAVFLLWWGYGVYGRAQSAKEQAWKHSADSAAKVTIQREREQMHADTVYDTTKIGYIQYRDRILRSGTATARDTATFKKADAVVATCDTSRFAAKAVIAAKSGELGIAREKPGDPRLQAYGEAMYDFLHLVPVARVGVTAKVLGPIYLSAAGDVSLEKRPTARAMAGLRINF